MPPKSAAVDELARQFIDLLADPLLMTSLSFAEAVVES
jgi:hypothetical protein